MCLSVMLVCAVFAYAIGSGSCRLYVLLVCEGEVYEDEKELTSTF